MPSRLDELLNLAEGRGPQPGEKIPPRLPPRIPTEFETAAEAVKPPEGQDVEKVAGRIIGTAILTYLGGSVGRALLPRAIPMSLRAGAGQAAGTTAGELAAGEEPGEALKTGAISGLAGGGTEALFRTGTRVLSSVGGVPTPGAEAVMEMGPIGAARATRLGAAFRGAPPRGEERRLATELTGRAHAETAGTARARPDLIGPTVRKQLNAIRSFFGKAPIASPPEMLGHAMGRAGKAVGAVTGPVDTTPIRTTIQGLLRKPVVPVKRGAGGRMVAGKLATPQEEVANAALKDALSRLPKQFGSLAEMESYLQRIRQPIKGAFGKDVPQLAKQDAKAIQAAVRLLRDKLLGGAESIGARAFKTASGRQQAIKEVLNLLEQKGGGLRVSAEGTMRRAFSNEEIARRLQALDPDLARQVQMLALQRAWTRPHPHMGLTRMAARPVAKVGAVTARPAGYGASILTALSRRE